jgi:hypothetical protein
MNNKEQLKRFPALYRAKLSCKVGRDALEELRDDRQDYALFCLIHAVEDIARHLMDEAMK